MVYNKYAYNKNYYKENKDKINATIRFDRLNNLEKYRLRDRINYLRNKERILLKNKMYRLRNKDKISISMRNYYLKNSELLRQKSNNHRIKPENKIKRNKYSRDRKKIDSVFKLRHSIGNALLRSLKGIKKRKRKRPWESMLGYTKHDLKNHLEKQFSDNMSWSNWGSYWELDHIIPLSWFKTESQLIKVGWRINNLQPLEKELNHAKHNLYVGNPKTEYNVIYLGGN